MIGSVVSHYRILEKLGAGGMGVVYKAQDLTLDRIVALKFLPQSFTANEADQARFLQEAKAASALNHPNVCNIHSFGEHQGQSYIDMECVEGQTVQEEISREISRQLSVKLAGEDERRLTKRSTENTEAYQLYLQGRFFWNKRKADDLQKAVGYFNRAIEKDPGFALAYAGLASAYAVLPEYSGLPAKDFISKAETAAKKALELDATLAEPHAVLGLVKCNYQSDWEGADNEFRRAMLVPCQATVATMSTPVKRQAYPC